MTTIYIGVAELPEPLADHEPLVIATTNDLARPGLLRYEIEGLYAQVSDGVVPVSQAFVFSGDVEIDDDAWLRELGDTEDGPIISYYTREV